DVDGRPVRAEVALAVSDESVTAIQADIAGDPRPFFFPDERRDAVNVAASVQGQRYLNLVEGKKGALIDDRVLEQEKRRERALAKDEERDFVVNGVDLPSPVAPPPPPMVERSAVAEAITVAASAPRVAKTEAKQNAAP